MYFHQITYYNNKCINCVAQSQHYAGVAFDVGQTLSNTERTAIRNTARNSGSWSYIEPASLTPTWVHYVLIAQDGLNTLGFRTGGLDGIFGSKTRNAVINYQRSRGLVVDGIVGCNTWRSIQENVIGIGRTGTTID